MLKNFLTLLFIFITATSLNSCKTIDVNGSNFNESDVEFIKKHKLNQNEIIDKLGSPTIKPDYSLDTWYYIFTKTSKTSITLPKIIEQKTLKLVFNDKGIVKHVMFWNGDFNNEVRLSSEVTETPGTEKTAIGQFFGNIGKFNKANRKKKK